MARRPNRKLARDDAEAVKARERVSTIIDSVDPEYLVESIKRAPSLRGMILGYIAELMFERHIPIRYPQILAGDIAHHDDHDRKVNKSDRTVTRNGRSYGIQLKSIQTNSIARNLITECLEADAQNDASDRRDVWLKDGSSVTTTCYLCGEYDILAVPLYPFTGTWEFAYKRNEDCARTTSPKYMPYQQQFLLATLERVCWPLSSEWTTNLMDLLTPDAGSPVARPDVITEPGGKIRVRQAGATILSNKD